MIKKTMKLAILFVASMVLYIIINYIFSMVLKGQFDIEDTLFYSTSFATVWTLIIGYKWYREHKKNR